MKAAHLLLAFLIMPGMSDAQTTKRINEKTKNKEVMMSTVDTNKEVLQKLYEALNKRNMTLLQDFIDEEYVGVNGRKGPEGFEGPIAVIRAFPDAQWKIETLIGEGDQVFIRWKIHGTHQGQFQHIAPTGKAIVSGGDAIYKFKDGKVIGTEVQTDRLGFLQQLGILPLDLTSLHSGQTNKDHIRFIDKFFVPAAGKAEFLERVKINRNFIKTLPGFVQDEAYERNDENGNLIYITIAVWENHEVLAKAKEAVQAEYKRQGFDLAAMFERLNITMDRGMYKEAAF